MNKKNLKKRVFTSLILFMITFLIFYSVHAMVISLLVLSIFSILEYGNLIKKITDHRFKQLLLNLIFIFYISIFCFLFVFFSNFYQLKFFLFILLLGCIASDIGGYIIGNIFKGPKLTKISPKKTLSGSIGSFIFTCSTVPALIFYFTNVFNFSIILIAFITSLTCQLGDLFFSFLKRKAKIKDTGSLFPGHGGVLDRLDGILFGIPSGLLTLILFF